MQSFMISVIAVAICTVLLFAAILGVVFMINAIVTDIKRYIRKGYKGTLASMAGGGMKIVDSDLKDLVAEESALHDLLLTEDRLKNLWHVKDLGLNKNQKSIFIEPCRIRNIDALYYKNYCFHIGGVAMLVEPRKLVHLCSNGKFVSNIPDEIKKEVLSILYYISEVEKEYIKSVFQSATITTKEELQGVTVSLVGRDSLNK